MRQAVELVFAGGGAAEADRVDAVRLGDELPLERSHLVGHAGLERIGRPRRDAVGPERHVVRAAADVMEPDLIAGLDRELIGHVLVGAALEHHVDVVRRATRSRGGRRRLLIRSRRRLPIASLLLAAAAGRHEDGQPSRHGSHTHRRSRLRKQGRSRSL